MSGFPLKKSSHGTMSVAQESQMKKLFLVALLALAGSGFLFAAENGNVNLSGTVAPTFNITFSATTYTGTMNDDGSDNIWPVSNVTVFSNFKNWNISVSSQNLGNLKLGATTEVIPYTFTLGSLVTDGSLSTAWTSVDQDRTPRTGTLHALSIKFKNTTGTYWEAGTYTDVITVTITNT
jgi:hypothetical protein